MKIKALHLVALLLLVVSCNPSDDNSGNGTTDEQFAQNFGASVQRDFIGQVVDKDNGAIAGATVTIGSSTVQTDANGMFILNDAGVHEKFAYVTAEKPGFIEGSRSLVPTSGKNNVKIMLIPAAPIATISTGIAAAVDLPNGTKVTFDGAFETEDGNAYSGDVSVSMFHLEPSDENLPSLMPGMLYAKGSDGEAKVLETFGMLNVGLRGSAGQKLQIKSGHKAQISMKIDDPQMANAPQSIPLWHFDEAVGYWKQQGEATRQGNFYVGEVSHFSWWNCDAMFPTINLTARVVLPNGQPLPSLIVRLAGNGLPGRTGITDDQGYVSGLVPANQSMTLEVIANMQCGEEVVLHTAQIGPFSGDAVLPDVVVDDLPESEVIVSTIEGSLVKCDNSNVTNGYVMLRYGSHSVVRTVSNGAFSFSVLTCTGIPEFSLEGFDFDNLQSTGEIAYNTNPPLTNVGGLVACGSVTEFMSFSVSDDDTPVNFIMGNIVSPQSGVDGEYHPILLYGNTAMYELPGLYIDSDITTPGAYTSGFVIQARYHIDNQLFGYNWTADNDYTVHLNKYGPVGDYIDLTFRATINPGSSSEKTITGTVHVKRDN